MDAWKPEQLQAMELGGNELFRKLMQEHGLTGASLDQRYSAAPAAEYRKSLQASARQSLQAPSPAQASERQSVQAPSPTAQA
eukprot:CAMPEP_0197671370 /NCGR_PEP_ID=MMETSP1338-20131121/76558_1 /TAXON_ID=43686 ORGANISM="Pelagodinium beii, Strain RCC1491" /NCGR_SAMPLE_ID=MMETSP1338 /ASSEMBLY_ACC=CAM_ASM_000754 /LENGTH=81 /DNA_ID=CAMNT_0043251249 /DNA_START=76 /DNA_END=318 /DNA_ORIENTATION=+